MMPQFCARCEAVVPLVDGEPGGFCAVCGLPQLRVSESVLDLAEAQGSESAGAVPAMQDQATGGAAVAPGALDWTMMERQRRL